MQTRREFFQVGLGAGLGGLLAASVGKKPFAAPEPPNQQKAGGAKLVLLGTMGGSRINKYRAAPSQVIVVNNDLYLVDCGNGVARQLALAGYNMKHLKGVYITHHHNDHNLDYGNVLYLSMNAGRRHKLPAYGPYPLQNMTESYLKLNEYTQEMSILGMPPLQDTIEVHEFLKWRVEPIMEDENVKVSVAPVEHPPCKAHAFRFDTKDRSITLSGDTRPCAELVKLAKGSDVLVHEVYYKPFMVQLAKRLPQYAFLNDWFPTAHTSTEEAGKIAHEAEVKTLVMTHFVPGDNPKITEEMWLEGARKHFKGEIIAGKDLLTV
jgi:ribonuclease BN (tRNA processing enzyme)